MSNPYEPPRLDDRLRRRNLVLIPQLLFGKLTLAVIAIGMFGLVVVLLLIVLHRMGFRLDDL